LIISINFKNDMWKFAHFLMDKSRNMMQKRGNNQLFMEFLANCFAPFPKKGADITLYPFKTSFELSFTGITRPIRQSFDDVKRMLKFICEYVHFVPILIKKNRISQWVSYKEAFLLTNSQ